MDENDQYDPDCFLVASIENVPHLQIPNAHVCDGLMDLTSRFVGPKVSGVVGILDSRMLLMYVRFLVVVLLDVAARFRSLDVAEDERG